jgi:hypothetical protein
VDYFNVTFSEIRTNWTDSFFFIVCVLLLVTNLWQGKVSVNTTNVVLQSISTQIKFFFSTATCFGPHYDRTAEVIELLNMEPYSVQHVRVIKLCLIQNVRITILVKVKLSLCLTNLALRHEDVWGSGCIDPHFLDLGTSWRWVVSFAPLPLYPRERAPTTHFIGCWVDPRAGLDDMEKWKIVYPKGTRTPASPWSSSP